MLIKSIHRKGTGGNFKNATRVDRREQEVKKNRFPRTVRPHDERIAGAAFCGEFVGPELCPVPHFECMYREVQHAVLTLNQHNLLSTKLDYIFAGYTSAK